MLIKHALASIVATAILALAGTAQAVVSYQLVKLDDFGPGVASGFHSRSFAVNNSGYTAGFARRYDPDTGADLGARPLRWNPIGNIAEELGIINTNSTGFSSQTALGVNDANTTVGYAVRYGTGGGTMAARWDPGVAAPFELPSLSTSLNSHANAINNTGTIVGDSALPMNSRRAVRWDVGGLSVTALGTLAPAGQTPIDYALAVNDAGLIVGFSSVSSSSNTHRAVKWVPGDDAAVPLGGEGSEAHAVTSSGVIAGHVRASGSTQPTHAAIWLPGSTMPIELPGLIQDPNVTHSDSIYGVNDAGIAVGYAQTFYDQNKITVAAVWDLNAGTVYDLNTLIPPGFDWFLGEALAINSLGQITGTAFEPTGRNDSLMRGFLLSPVPEPSSTAVILLSLCPLLRRRPVAPSC